MLEVPILLSSMRVGEYNTLLIGRSRVVHQLPQSGASFGSHAKGSTHHFRCRPCGPGFACGRLSHARLPHCSLCVRRLHVDWPPRSPGLTGKSLLAHGGTGVCGDCPRPGALPHLPVYIPISKSGTIHARFRPTARPRTSEKLRLRAQAEAPFSVVPAYSVRSLFFTDFVGIGSVLISSVAPGLSPACAAL